LDEIRRAREAAEIARTDERRWVQESVQPLLEPLRLATERAGKVLATLQESVENDLSDQVRAIGGHVSSLHEPLEQSHAMASDLRGQLESEARALQREAAAICARVDALSERLNQRLATVVEGGAARSAALADLKSSAERLAEESAAIRASIDGHAEAQVGREQQARAAVEALPTRTTAAFLTELRPMFERLEADVGTDVEGRLAALEQRVVPQLASLVDDAVAQVKSLLQQLQSHAEDTQRSVELTGQRSTERLHEVERRLSTAVSHMEESLTSHLTRGAEEVRTAQATRCDALSVDIVRLATDTQSAQSRTEEAVSVLCEGVSARVRESAGQLREEIEERLEALRQQVVSTADGARESMGALVKAQARSGSMQRWVLVIACFGAAIAAAALGVALLRF
jgi:gas vesicle protein/predicted  nucleic acid-binding Zn-ribbon protein